MPVNIRRYVQNSYGNSAWFQVVAGRGKSAKYWCPVCEREISHQREVPEICCDCLVEVHQNCANETYVTDKVGRTNFTYRCTACTGGKQEVVEQVVAKKKWRLPKLW